MTAPAQKLRIIVGGMVGQFPLGGVAWDYFHYCLGLHELGHDVYYYEDTWVWPHDPVKGYATDDASYTAKFIGDFFDRYAPELSHRWTYRLLHETAFGMTREAFNDVARTADVFLNVSGACFFPDNLNPRAIKVFMDTDPGYNQIVMHTRPAWSQNVDRWIEMIHEHDVHLTYAENIGQPDCRIPTCGIAWRPTRCVATLADWAAVRNSAPPADAPFTTIMTWGYFKGAVVHDGVEYFAKSLEFEKFESLPSHTDVPLALAVAGYTAPIDQIKAAGWQVIDGSAATQKVADYVNFIRDSAGEWSIAKNVFVGTRSGWFSCRTACYLAAGRPAVVQDTAWSKFVPSGDGLFAFNTMEQAVDALRQIAADPVKHRAAAYERAREFVAADRVLPPMIDAIYAKDAAAAVKPPGIG